jgi:YVTN family beta-propeller protein
MTIGLCTTAAAGAATVPTTPSGWGITPAGRLILAPHTSGPGMPGPWAVKITPDGRHALVTSSGSAAKAETVETYELATGKRRGLQVYKGLEGQSVFYGLAFSPDGRRAWASGGGEGVVHAYGVRSDGTLVARRDIKAGHFPTGIAFGHTPLGDRLYVADNLGARPFSAGSYEDPPGHEVLVLDPDTGTLVKRIDLGSAHFPFGVAFNRDATKAYVTNWTGRSVSVIDTRRQRRLHDILLSPITNPLQADHPTAIAANPQNDEIYTANANSDTVSVIDATDDRLAATIDVALVPGAPKGGMPEGLAISPDGRTLYVSLAGENAVAVVDLRRRQTTGFIPTAWYPADVAVSPDGARLVVANTNGLGAGPNPCGPFTPLPVLECPKQHPALYPGYPEAYYLGSMIKGNLEVIDLPTGDALGPALSRWTAQVRANNHVSLDAPRKPRYLDPIKHVIYVIKENRTYDQVFGDLDKGNGDPSLTLFKDDSAPNHRELVRRFTLLDNFYVDAEVSQDGHPWSTQATATDYVDKAWPFDYGWAYYRTYSSEFVPLAQQFASEPLASDPSVPRSASAATAGYIWDNAYDHGVSFRDYGEGTPWDDPTNCHSNTVSSDLTRLQSRFGAHVDPQFPGWNIKCSDHRVREPEWEREFRQFVKNGNLPGLEIVYFPSDHTNGTAPHAATPASYMADNDLALGRLVEAVSHSPYWKSTAIVVLEDDAQDGPDHVDAHRSPALVISPYTQHGRVDSTHYSTAAALATIEDLLGLEPMSIFDQRATRMWPAFSPWPNMRSYTAIQPDVVPFGDPDAPTNGAGAHLGAQSAAQNWSVPDGPDKEILNEAIWWSVKGDGVPMPDPHTAFGDTDDE